MSATSASSLGQLLILEVHDHRWSSRLERRLRAQQPSGILLSSACLRTPGQTAELLHQIARELGTPPFLALTEEGGSVNPLRALLPPLPVPRVLAGRGPAAVRRAGELIGKAMRLLGFNLNFAPRLDLSNPDVKPALDTQTFGPDPKLVAQCGRAFSDGLSKHKILACGKHFPGRSVAEYNANGLPLVGKPMAGLWQEDLVPFRELLPRLPFIKLSNASYKAYDFDVHPPAATSPKVIHDLLRVKLGYRGLAVANPLELIEEASRHLSPGGGISIRYDALLESVVAGCDLQVVMEEDGLAESVLQVMAKGLESGALPSQRASDALGRIRTARKGLKPPSGKLSARSLDRLARELEEFSQQVRAGGEIEA